MRPFSQNRALIDTGAYYALADAGETRHQDAVAIANQLEAGRWRLFTTNFLVAETHALLIARLNHFMAARVLREIDESATTIVRVSAADERRAREIIYHYRDKDFSLADAASFAVMERLRIGFAFTFDRHFEQYGFSVLQGGVPR